MVLNSSAPAPFTQNLYNGWGNDSVSALGKALFYDKNLSLNNAISCGSCHIQSHAFADNHQYSRGLNNGYTSRNASAIFNNGQYFWDGRAGNADTAVFMPVMSHLEMNIYDLNILPAKLSALPYYAALFRAAYHSPGIDVYRIRRALASFVQSLNCVHTKFDDQTLLPEEQQGEIIFEGKGMCYSCHNDRYPLFENIGLDVNYSDKGRGKITHYAGDDGRFKVPSLRNIAYSAPYMHDGRYATLREVIDHYSEGIENSPNLSWMFRDIPADSLNDPFFALNDSHPGFPVKPLHLTEHEKHLLEVFLTSGMTDTQFLTDPKFSDPFTH